MATIFIIRWEIKWIAADFLACAVKMQHLCLLHWALDWGDTCSDELLGAWFLQECDVSSPVRWTMLGPSSAHKANGKRLLCEPKCLHKCAHYMHNKRILELLDGKIMTNQTSYICGLQQWYEFNLHNHAFICHNNKRRVVPFDYSNSSNYLDILFLTIVD